MVKTTRLLSLKTNGKSFKTLYQHLLWLAKTILKTKCREMTISFLSKHKSKIIWTSKNWSTEIVLKISRLKYLKCRVITLLWMIQVKEQLTTISISHQDTALSLKTLKTLQICSPNLKTSSQQNTHSSCQSNPKLQTT